MADRRPGLQPVREKFEYTVTAPDDHTESTCPVRGGQRVELRTAETVLLRPIAETDGPLLTDLFSRLSRQAIRWRFLGPVNVLSDDLLRQFTHLDYVRNFALAAVVHERSADRVIAVGRYAWNDEDRMPEAAVVVRDDWQGKGLGTILYARIAAAAARNGFRRFLSLIESDNAAMRSVIEKAGFPYEVVQKGILTCYIADISGLSERLTQE